MFTQLACSRTHRFRNLTFTQYIGIMAVRRNKIPRLLIGAGGVHLYDLPGVTYPPEILKNTEKPPEKKPRLEPCLFLSHPPRWGMPTAEVARQLGCSEGAARMRLRRFNVEHCYVRNKSGRICAYWRREQVKNLLQSVNKVVEFMPNCYTRPRLPLIYCKYLVARSRGMSAATIFTPCVSCSVPARTNASELSTCARKSCT